MSKHISELATAAYVFLPECILPLAVVIVIGHVRTWLYIKTWSTGVWAILYGIPTFIFLALSLITLGFSVVSVSFIMPIGLVVTRALAGYMFALTSLLYMQLGAKQERDRLQEKEDKIAELRQEANVKIAELEQKVLIKEGEVIQLKQLLGESKNAEAALIKVLNKSSENALEAYSEECINWLNRDHKTVMIDEITYYTGHNKRRITSAISRGLLKTATRNGELILVSSLREWLEKTPAPTGDTLPALHVVNG